MYCSAKNIVYDNRKGKSTRKQFTDRTFEDKMEITGYLSFLHIRTCGGDADLTLYQVKENGR